VGDCVGFDRIGRLHAIEHIGFARKFHSHFIFTNSLF
jgi:hypothetical protein